MIDIQELNGQWKQFCNEEFTRWSEKNPRPPLLAWNVKMMGDMWDDRHEKWKAHIKDVGDQWWRERGYKLHWPAESTGPLQAERILSWIPND